MYVAERADDISQLKRWVRAGTTPQRVVWRSRIVLLALDGLSCRQISSRLAISPPTVRLWLRRFANEGASSLLHDAPRRGRHPSLDPSTIMCRLREAHLVSEDGNPTSLRVAAAYFGVSPSTVWRAMHKRRET